jgi:hypothetical protein
MVLSQAATRVDQSDVAEGPGLMRIRRNQRPYQSLRDLAAHMRPSVKRYIDASLRRKREWKYYDAPATITADGSSPPNGLNSLLTAANITNADGAMVDLFAPTQGYATNQRLGDVVKLKAQSFMYRIVQNSSASAGDRQCVRVIMVQWLSNTVPNFSDVVESVAWNAPYNVDKQHQYMVIYDRMHSLVKGASSEQQVGFFENNKFAGDGRVRFDAAATTGSNKFYLYYYTDVAANLPAIDPYSRIEYYD